MRRTLPVKLAEPRLVKAPPEGEGWQHEIKFDGWRILALRDERGIRLYSRQGRDWTDRLSELSDELASIPSRDWIVDAELVALRADGGCDFYGLQREMRKKHPSPALVLRCFDLLRVSGRDLIDKPLMTRQQRLQRLLERVHARGKAPHVLFGGPLPAALLGSAALALADELGLEGIVSKRRASRYPQGPTRDWVKCKTQGWRQAAQHRFKYLRG